MKKRTAGVLAIFMAGMVMIGCLNPLHHGPAGSLTVRVSEQVSKSLLPTISMDPTSYEVAGSGPNQASFEETITGGDSVTIEGLAFGAWSVTVVAKNAEEVAIGAGSSSATVLSNGHAVATVTVLPYEGFGTLSLNLSWPASQVQSAGIASTLLPHSGAPRNLSFAVDSNAGLASFSAADVATGYHTLTVKLQDNGYTVMGAVEVVRIVRDQLTSGSFSFEDINQATGELEVSIRPEMGEPLEVSISGAGASKAQNQSMSLGAAVSNYDGNVTFVWYVNGDATDTGASFDFTGGWAQGFYRIDVTAFSVDGSRAGSASARVEVVNSASVPVGELRFYPTSTMQMTPDIFWTGSEYGITWFENVGNNEIFFARADNGGQIIGEVIRITDSPRSDYAPHVHWNGSSWVIVWESYHSDGSYNIYMRYFAGNAVALSDTITLNLTHVGQAYDYTSLVWDGSNYALVWRVSGTNELRFAKFNRFGEIQAEVPVVDSGNASYHPELAWNGSSYALTWIDQRHWEVPALGNDEVYFKQLAADGTALTDDIRLSDAPGASWDPALVWTGDRYAISWVDARNGELHAVFSFLSAAGIKELEEISISSGTARQDYPTIVWSEDRAVITFRNGGYLSSTIVDGSGAILYQDVTASTDGVYSSDPRSVWDGEAAATVWYDSRDGIRQIYFFRLSDDGLFF